MKELKVTKSKTGIKRLVIKFSYDITVLDTVRSLCGRKFYPDSKLWRADLTFDNLQALKSAGFDISNILENIKEEEPTEIDVFDNQLFPYQKEGVNFINQKNGNVLIADEMGLGKSIQSLAWIELHSNLRPVLIVCPASLKLNWAKEIMKWMPNSNIEVLNGTEEHIINGDIVIINYDILKNWEITLKNNHFKVVIMDEAHYIKNSKAQRTKSTIRLAKTIPHKIILTGTPIESRPSELYNIIHLLAPNLFSNKWAYLNRYCGAKHNGYGWDFSGSSNINELHSKLISSIMIRRKKKDVLKDLPDKIYSFVPLHINNRKEYKEAEQDLIAFIKKSVRNKAYSKMEEINSIHGDTYTIDEEKLKDLEYEKTTKAEEGGVLFQIEVLKQLAVKGKMNDTIKWITDFLESGEKLVVFAIHKFVIDELMAHFKNIAVKIDGSVSSVNRSKAVDSFQNNPKIKLFIGNIKAAGVGLTLTSSSNVVILEYPWTPGELSQAIDRCHRIGQKDTVNVHYLFGINTIEEKIAKLIDSKQRIVNEVLDGTTNEEDTLLSGLINNLI